MMSPDQSPNKNVWPWPQKRWEKRSFGIRSIAGETQWFMLKYLESQGALEDDWFSNAQTRGLFSETIKFRQNRQSDSLSVFLLNERDLSQVNHKIFPEFYDETHRLQSCHQLLSRLIQVLDFAPNHLQRNYIDQNKVKWGDYTPDYIFNTLFNQISIDLNIIHRIFQQHRLSGNDKVTHEGYLLHLADILAANALQPAIAMGICPNDISVLTYVKNKIDVRLVPYDNVMLLGIPNGITTTLMNWMSNDYLAIPHEMGHFVFERGLAESKKAQSLKDKITHSVLNKNLLLPAQESEGEPWFTRWLEELFADVYGCIVAGPATVLSFQELLASGQPGIHEPADNLHPIPPLRPLIQTMILRQIAADQSEQDTVDIINELADKLDTNWESWVRENWYQHLPGEYIDLRSHEFSIHGIPQKISGEKILEPIETVIELIFVEIQGMIQQMMQDTYSLPWLQPLEKNMTLADLYHKFSTGELIQPPPAGRHKPIAERETPFTKSLGMDEPDFKFNSTDLLDIDKWANTVLFEAWATEGPQGSAIGS